MTSTKSTPNTAPIKPATARTTNRRPNLPPTHDIGAGSMPAWLPEGRIVSNREALEDATYVLQRSGAAAILRRVEAQKRGTKRVVSLHTAFVIFLGFKIQAPKKDFQFADIKRWADAFTPSQAKFAGLPGSWRYDHLQDAFAAVVKLLEPAESERRVSEAGVIYALRKEWLPTLDQFVNAAVAASIPSALPPTPVQAIDSTDIRSHARSRMGQKEPDPADTYRPDDSRPSREFNHDPDEWPKKGADGRMIVGPDSQARLGWCTRTNSDGSNSFNGWDGHLLVDAGSPGLEFSVPFIRGIAVRPAGSYKAQAGIDLLDSLRDGITFQYLVADRGYSYAKPLSWARPLKERGLVYAHDLHVAQRRPHPSDVMPGVIWIDGTLFPDCLPKRLRTLDAFKPGMRPEAKDALIAQYDERAQWAFVPNRRYENGDIQYKGPARAKHVRCVNYGPSARLGERVPMTNCAPGAACKCAATKVIPRSEAEWERQEIIYGTSQWAAVYGLRNLVESANAQLKFWRGTMRQHGTCVFGTTANTLVLMIHVIAINISLRRDAYGADVTLKTADPRCIPPRKRRRRPARPPMHARPGNRPRGRTSEVRA